MSLRSLGKTGRCGPPWDECADDEAERSHHQTVRAAAERALPGKVVGIDHSALMHRTAMRRNARAIETGRVELHVRSVDAMPPFVAPFDKVFAVKVYKGVHILVRPGRRTHVAGVAHEARWHIALTFQPRNRGTTNEDTPRGGERIADSLRAARFLDVRVEMLPLRPVTLRLSLEARPEVAALFYSLIESAKLGGVDPKAYLLPTRGIVWWVWWIRGGF